MWTDVCLEPSLDVCQDHFEQRRSVRQRAHIPSDTHFANVITTEAVYCFNQELTLNKRALAERWVNPVLTFETEHSNKGWGALCDVYCPQKYRKTVNDKGVLQYRWTDPIFSPVDIGQTGELPDIL
jgi:hypothetical protein